VKGILIDEFHLSMVAPRGLTEEACEAIRAALDQPGFQQRLRRAAQAVARKHPALARVRVKLSR
jgi:hypothetical protein